MGLFSGGSFGGGGAKDYYTTTETFTDERNAQALADNFSTAVAGIDVRDGGSFNLTLTDQGAVLGAFSLADRSFGSIENIAFDSNALVRAATRDARDSFSESGRLAHDSFNRSGRLAADSLELSAVLAADAFERASVHGLEYSGRASDAYERAAILAADAFERSSDRSAESERLSSRAFESAAYSTGDAYETAKQLSGAVNTESLMKWFVGAVVVLGVGFIVTRAR